MKKAEICNHFAIPMVRVKEGHLDAKVFGDTAVAFFIWQLFCVDAFVKQCGNDPYEPYDPAWFVSVQGKDRSFPFEYAGRIAEDLVFPSKAGTVLDQSNLTNYQFLPCLDRAGLRRFASTICGTRSAACSSGMARRWHT